jgi:PAS domain S-box-containing protein
LYSKDEYVRQKHPRSALCLPIVKQTKPIGALYLENNLTPGAFTSDRIAVLEVLASQAAISIENANLYAGLQRSEANLAQGQRISHTGSIGRNLVTGEVYWSDETYRIFELDRSVIVLALTWVAIAGESHLPKIVPADGQPYTKLQHVGAILILFSAATVLLLWSRRRSVLDLWLLVAICAWLAEGITKWLSTSFRFGLSYYVGGTLFIVSSIVLLVVLLKETMTLYGRLAVSLVTVRRLSAENLQRSEAYLSEAQALSHTGSFGWKTSNGEIHWSEESYNIFEFDRAVKPKLEFVFQRTHPDDKDLVQQKIDRAPRERADFDLEHRLLMPDGSLKYIHVVARALGSCPGDLEYVGAVTDITERKQAEMRLRESEADLAEAQRLSHTGSWAWNPATGENRYWSDECFRLMGFDPAAGMPPFETVAHRFHTDDQPIFAETLGRARRERAEFEVDYRIIHPGGEIRDIHGVGHPVLGPSGELVEFVGSVMDVTERKRAEDKIRQSEAYLAEAQGLARMGSGVWSVPGWDPIYLSDEWYRIYGFDPRLGLSAWEDRLQRMHPGDQAKVQEAKDRATREKSDYKVDHRIVLPDGIVKYTQTVGHPVLNAYGDVEQFVCTMMDVTESKRAEEALHAAISERTRLAGFREEIGLALAHGANLRGILQDCAEAMVRNLDAVFARIWILSSDGRELQLQASAGMYTRLDGSRSRIPFGQFKIGLIAQERKPHLTNDVQNDPGVHDKDWARREGMVSFAGYPLLVEDRAVGVMGMFSQRALPQSTVETLSFVADTIAQGIERKRAEEALRKAFEEIKGLRDQLYQENIALKEEVDRASMFEEIVGTSPSLRAVLSRVSKVAPTDSTVLITGETGTGKELIARAVHRRSDRSSRPFVSVNCAAIPRDLLASELFGHEKGAFTGAIQRRIGRFELAEGGTLFLDEIGELPAETQIALLRVLQEREFERVGGIGSIRTNVRVIAATNRDLQAAIAAGTFRSDLFYRLNVFPIEVPPLRERREDIPVLVGYFIDRFARKAGKSIRSVDKMTMESLQSYPWPGNIRELQNIIERSVIVCDTENFSVDESWLSRPPLASEPNGRPELSRKLANKEIEMIEAALRESGGRVSGPSGAAVRLGIPGSTLDSKIRSLRIDKNRFKST